MDTDIVKLGFGREIVAWLEKLGQGQAMHVLECIAKFFKFAEHKRDFFQGCGFYAVGSSLRDENFNDVDIVLVGLDFRTVVDYDKIFLKDPETLIEKGIIVEPRLFAIIKEAKDGEPMILEAITEVKDPDFGTSIEAWGRMGLEYKGVLYDYNIEWCAIHSLNLDGFCSYHAHPSWLTKKIYALLCPPDEHSLNYPFDVYGFGGTQKFLVYRFSVGAKKNLPGVKNSILEEIKPVDFCIHAENLYREDWKKHQAALGLPYLTLKEWPEINRVRKTITKLDYPRFIDPGGTKRAQKDIMFFSSFIPDEDSDISDIIDVKS